MSADQAVIYHFITELMLHKNLSDPTCEAMMKRFGDRGMMEAITLVSHSRVGACYSSTRSMPPALARCT